MTLKSGFFQAWLGLAAVPGVGRAQGREVLTSGRGGQTHCWILKPRGYFKPSEILKQTELTWTKRVLDAG